MLSRRRHGFRTALLVAALLTTLLPSSARAALPEGTLPSGGARAVRTAAPPPSAGEPPGLPPAPLPTEPIPVSPAAAVDDLELASALEAYLASQEGEYGIVVRDLRSGQTVRVNADRPFLAASTYKLLVLYRVYQQVEAGALALDTRLDVSAGDAAVNGDEGLIHPGQRVSVGEAVEAMIVVSDNTAAFALARAVGGWGVVAGAADELGMRQTWLEGEDFWTTADDMAAFFQALAGGRLVSEWASAQMVDVLQRQALNDRIPAGLPPGVAVAHKTGELAGVRNDVGIVYGPGSPFVVVVLGRGPDPASLVETIAGVSRLAYDQFTGSSLAARPP